MRILRKHAPSPALVVAVVALIAALGGTSYAAFALPKGSVGTKQLRNNAVTNSKLGPNSVGTGKIRNGAVTGSKLNFSGFAVPNATNATNAINATNAVNATTATTANALSGVQIVQGPTQTIGPTTQQSSTVACPAGTIAIGGEQVNGGGNTVSTNEVALNGGSVTVFLNNTGATAVTWHAYAVCVRGSVVGTSVARSAEAK